MRRPDDAEGGPGMLAAYNSNLYTIVKVVHILCAIIGFGGVMLNGVYAAQMRGRPAREAAPIAQAVLRVSSVAEYFIYAVFILGLALVGIGHSSHGATIIDFGQTWIWLSIVLFVVGLGLNHGFLRPRVKRMTTMLTEEAATPAGAIAGPPSGQLLALGKQVATTEAVLDVVLVVILVLMVFKPGSPISP
jgi:uncharacterized membrane protein